MERVKEVVGRGGRCLVDGGLETRYKGIKYSSRGFITEERGVEEVTALHDDVGVLLFDQVI